MSGPPILQRIRDMLYTATVTQDFGPSSLSGEPSYAGYSHFHRGVDLVLQGGPGSPIYAPASGRVLWAGMKSQGQPGYGFGNYVEILAPNGFTYILGHMSDTQGTFYGSGEQPHTVQTGQLIHAGDIIGHEGATGYATGPHLHLEIMDPHGQPLDPGETGNDVFYTAYHDLGFGAGYPGGNQYPVIPDPTAPNQLPTVPEPFPTNPGDRHDRRFVVNRNLLGGGFTTSGTPGEGDPNDPFSGGGGNPGPIVPPPGPGPNPVPSGGGCPQGATFPAPSSGGCPPGYTESNYLCICDQGGTNGGGSGTIFSWVTDIVSRLSAYAQGQPQQITGGGVDISNGVKIAAIGTIGVILLWKGANGLIKSPEVAPVATPVINVVSAPVRAGKAIAARAATAAAVE